MIFVDRGVKISGTVRDVDELKQRLIHVCRDSEQSVVNDTINGLCRRLRGCNRAKGGHFKHLY